jgi:hypothetical protein
VFALCVVKIFFLAIGGLALLRLVSLPLSGAVDVEGALSDLRLWQGNFLWAQSVSIIFFKPLLFSRVYFFLARTGK